MKDKSWTDECCRADGDGETDGAVWLWGYGHVEERCLEGLLASLVRILESERMSEEKWIKREQFSTLDVVSIPFDVVT